MIGSLILRLPSASMICRLSMPPSCALSARVRACIDLTAVPDENCPIESSGELRQAGTRHVNMPKGKGMSEYYIDPKHLIEDEASLRALFSATHALALRKCQTALDKHAR